MANTENDTPDLSNASDDDLKAMGLPGRFTLDDLKAFMSEEEIERELASDDPLVKVDPAEAKEKPEAAEGDDPDKGDEKEDAAATAEEQPAPVEETTAPAIPDPVIRLSLIHI